MIIIITCSGPLKTHFNIDWINIEMCFPILSECLVWSDCRSVDLTIHFGLTFNCCKLLYLHLLMNELPLLIKDVEALLKILFQHDGAPPHFALLESGLRESVDWLCWSSNLAAGISGPNLTLVICMGSYKRDFPQDERTDESGTHASIYECCCLHTRTPWNDVTDNKLVSEPRKTVHRKRWRTYSTFNLRCIS
jgi:hypothetical protein